MSKENREMITISVIGTKKFKQFVINQIAELLMREDFGEEVAKPGCSFKLESTIKPDLEGES